VFDIKSYRWGFQIALLLLVTAMPLPVAALDDPTKPPFYSAENAEIESEEATLELVLSSILISSDRRLAVINGQILKRNELIDGARVVSIEAGRVLLDNAGERIELFLLPAMKTKSRRHD